MYLIFSTHFFGIFTNFMFQKTTDERPKPKLMFSRETLVTEPPPILVKKEPEKKNRLFEKVRTFFGKYNILSKI